MENDFTAHFSTMGPWGGGAVKLDSMWSTPTNAPITCTAYVLPYNFHSEIDKQKNELGRWKSRIVAIFLLFLTL